MFFCPSLLLLYLLWVTSFHIISFVCFVIYLVDIVNTCRLFYTRKTLLNIIYPHKFEQVLYTQLLPLSVLFLQKEILVCFSRLLCFTLPNILFFLLSFSTISCIAKLFPLFSGAILSGSFSVC